MQGVLVLAEKNFRMASCIFRQSEEAADADFIDLAERFNVDTSEGFENLKDELEESIKTAPFTYREPEPFKNDEHSAYKEKAGETIVGYKADREVQGYYTN